LNGRAILILLLLLSPLVARADGYLPFDHNLATRETEPGLIRHVIPADPVQDKTQARDLKNRRLDVSPLYLPLAFSIRFFQTFISPQDGPSCIYTPTCSEYGMMSIRMYGPFTGILMAGDRWLRCNYFGFAAYDPPEDNHFDCSHK
jgi:uncharacterized protein